MEVRTDHHLPRPGKQQASARSGRTSKLFGFQISSIELKCSQYNSPQGDTNIHMFGYYYCFIISFGFCCYHVCLEMFTK